MKQTFYTKLMVDYKGQYGLIDLGAKASKLHQRIMLKFKKSYYIFGH